MSRAVGVLRPEPGNAATALRIQALGHVALRLPLFAVRPVAWTPPDPATYDSLLLTSANALRHGGPGLEALTRLPVHAVGEATALAARAAGFTIVDTGNAGIEAMRPPGRVLRLTGRDHRPFAGADMIVVYVSDPIATDLTVLADRVALLHSKRAARELAARIGDRANIALAAISPEVAEAAGGGWRAIAVADQPTDDALIVAALQLAD